MKTPHEKALHSKMGRREVYEKRAKYFSRNHEAFNNLTPEGKKRSGVGFSYATQKFHPRKVGHDIAGTKRSAKELRERGL